MKKTLFCLALLLGGVAQADGLADANALYAKKSYPQALTLFTKLANGGNAEAQLRLAEMHANGEGVAVDAAKAEAWYKKAAAKGNKAAIAALEKSTQREARRTDIDYWIGKYDGSELHTGKYRCPAPRIPQLSKQNDEIDSVVVKIEAWQTCYNEFVRNLNASSPLTQRIPKDIAELMTKEEAERSKEYLAGVFSRVAEDAKVAAKLVLADFGAWRDATDKYIAEHNRIVKDAKAAPKRVDDK